MPSLWSPPRLYALCLEMLIPLFEKVGYNHDWEDDKARDGPLDFLAGRVTEDLMLEAYYRAARTRHQGCWTDDWKVFLTPKAQSVVLSWDKGLLRFVSSRCQKIKQVLVSRWKTFTPESLSWLPKTVSCLDFDGELFYRGRQGPSFDFTSTNIPRNWLPEAEAILKGLHVWRQKGLGLDSTRSITSPEGLVELHLGTAQVTAADLCTILGSCPNLRLLRHYQLVTALNQLHGEQWRRNERLPKYKLRNLDMDFSHVVRCRMSPEAVLPPDVLQLAVLLCPDAAQVRVRFDCSTSHDVLSPLATMLRCLRELSVVCVTSGERSHLDFSDLTPILEQHGSDSLRSLELKVIEEVDVHVIISSCPKLERLVLSGCGNVTPPTCPNYNCNLRSSKARSALRLKRLRLLFFADGDDFSWDHDLPPCFWRATLGAAKKGSSSGHRSRLEGIFLESPRIPADIADEIFSRWYKEKSRSTPFPDLQVLSLCRYPEITLDHLAAICGLDLIDYGSGFRKIKDSLSTSLRYIRLSDCEKMGPREERHLRNMIRSSYPTDNVHLVLK